jgi:hypothetical protein
MVSVSKSHNVTVPIEGYAIKARVARLTFDQAEEHRRRMAALVRTSQRQRGELKAAAVLGPDEFARLRDLHETEDRETVTMVRAAVETYVTVEPNQIAVDGHEVTSGKDLMDYFGADTDLVMLVMLAIGQGSSVSATTGKTSGSPSDSMRSSDAPDASGPAVDGPRPEGTADPAAPEATTVSAAATAATDTPSSGSMATLN